LLYPAGVSKCGYVCVILKKYIARVTAMCKFGALGVLERRNSLFCVNAGAYFEVLASAVAHFGHALPVHQEMAYTTWGKFELHCAGA
jgi:hypothetical protein